MKLLGISSGQTFVWCVAGGVLAACVGTFYSKAIVGKIVRGLVKEEAFDENSAKRLEDIGCKGPLYRFHLRKGTAQNGAIMQGAKGKYYIDSGKVDKLVAKYGTKEPSFAGLCAALGVACLAGVLFAVYYDDIVDIIGGLID